MQEGRPRLSLFKMLLKIIAIIASVAIVLGILNFIPTFSLKTNGMNELQGSFITVYYEKEEEAARDVFELANGESERVAASLGFDSPQNIRMYIYDSQSTFQTKKYGLFALLLDLDWYVGDNRGTNVLLTSPANPGKDHGYEDIVSISTHEMVHAYNSILNNKMPLWLNEGLALYLSNGSPSGDLYSTSGSVPSIKQMHTSNPVEFSNIGGYEFAYTYIEYLDKNFGWDNVLVLATTADYRNALGKNETEVYDGWIEFLKQKYSA